MSSAEFGEQRGAGLPPNSSLPAVSGSHLPAAAICRRPHVGRVGTLLVVLGCIAGLGVPRGSAAERRDIVPAAPAFKKTKDGQRLLWYRDELTLVVDPSVSELGPQAYDATVHGFGAWIGAGVWLPRLRFEQAAARVGRPGLDGRNTVTFGEIEDPGHEHDIAYTITYVDQKKGEIVEADVVLNSKYEFGVLDENRMQGMDSGLSCAAGGREKLGCSEGYDVQNVVAHEAGHFFGLGEDRDEHAATMFACTGQCEVHKRELEDSDVRTMSELYGGSRVLERSYPVCSITRAGQRSSQHLGLLSAALLVGLSRLRRMRA